MEHGVVGVAHQLHLQVGGILWHNVHKGECNVLAELGGDLCPGVALPPLTDQVVQRGALVQFGHDTGGLLRAGFLLGWRSDLGLGSAGHSGLGAGLLALLCWFLLLQCGGCLLFIGCFGCCLCHAAAVVQVVITSNPRAVCAGLFRA